MKPKNSKETTFEEQYRSLDSTSREMSVPESMFSKADFLFKTQALKSPLRLKELPSLTKLRSPNVGRQEPFISPRAIALHKLKIDKEREGRLDKRSRDLSHAFDSKGRYVVKEHEMSATADNIGVSRDAQIAMMYKEGKVRDQERTKRGYTPSPEKVIEKHLISIYKSPDIMNNPKLLDDQAEKLKKSEEQSRMPPAALGVPSSRRQVELLAQWIKAMTEHTFIDKNITESERTERLIIAYKFALLEINRQVSVQCLERGELLKDIIDNYISLISRKTCELSNTITLMKKEMKDQNELHNSIVKKLEANISNLNKEIEDKAVYINERQETIDFLRATKERQEGNLAEMKKKLKHYKHQINHKNKVLESVVKAREDNPVTPQPNLQVTTVNKESVLSTKSMREYVEAKLYESVPSPPGKSKLPFGANRAIQNVTILTLPKVPKGLINKETQIEKSDLIPWTGEKVLNVSYSEGRLQVNDQEIINVKYVLAKEKAKRKRSLKKPFKQKSQFRSRRNSRAQVFDDSSSNTNSKNSYVDGGNGVVSPTPAVEEEPEKTVSLEVPKLVIPNNEPVDIGKTESLSNNIFHPIEPNLFSVPAIIENNATSTLLDTNNPVPTFPEIKLPEPSNDPLLVPMANPSLLATIRKLQKENSELKRYITKLQNNNLNISLDEISFEKGLAAIKWKQRPLSSFKPHTSSQKDFRNLSQFPDLSDNEPDSNLLDTSALSVQPGFKKDERARGVLNRVLLNHHKYKKFVGMPPKIIHKFITSIYQEVMQIYEKSIESLEAPFHMKKSLRTMVYKKMLNQYGILKVAEKKYVKLIKGVSFYMKHSIRISLFGSFIGIGPAYNGDFEFYLKALYFLLKKCKVGTIATSLENPELHLVSHTRGMELIRKYFYMRVKGEEWFKLKKKVEGLKTVVNKNVSMVDVDQLLKIALEKFRTLLDNVEPHIKDIFNACDLNGNGKIEAEEFLLLCRYLEPETLPAQKALQLFHKLSDKDGQSRTISFSSFAIGCVEHAIFTVDAQRRFLHIKDQSECPERFQQILKIGTIKLIEQRLKAANQYDVYYTNWLKPIEQAMEKAIGKDVYVLLVKLKFIEAESIRIYTEYYSKRILGPFQAFIDLINTI